MERSKQSSKTWNYQDLFINKKEVPKPYLNTQHGVLYEGDCLDFLPLLDSKTIDTVFADPPFNLGKLYGKRVNDNLADQEYLNWCKRWVLECFRVLKPGGAFFYIIFQNGIFTYQIT